MELLIKLEEKAIKKINKQTIEYFRWCRAMEEDKAGREEGAWRCYNKARGQPRRISGS